MEALIGKLDCKTLSFYPGMAARPASRKYSHQQRGTWVSLQYETGLMTTQFPIPRVQAYQTTL